jgi:FKBP-type peptidyl-prolyl cis-trans isomerase FklB
VKKLYVPLAISILFFLFSVPSFAQSTSKLVVDGIEYKSVNLEKLFDSRFKEKIAALNEGVSFYDIKNKPTKIETEVGGDGYVRLHVNYDTISDVENIFHDWKDNHSIIAILDLSFCNDYGKLMGLLNQYAVMVATSVENEKSEKQPDGTSSYSATTTINPQIIKMTKIVRLDKKNGDWFQYYGYTYAKGSSYAPNFDIQIAPFVKVKIGKNEPVTVRGEIDSRRGSFILTKPIGASVRDNDIKLLRKFFINSELAAKQEARQKARQKESPEKNTAGGEKFLAENAKREGIVALPSGLQYKVLQEGTGATPKATDTVTVNYRGTLIDGTEFDNTYKRGQSATFQVGGVILGWIEGLQLMKEGGKYQFFIPAGLAYGERGAGQVIGPNATLIFEVDLVKVQ